MRSLFRLALFVITVTLFVTLVACGGDVDTTSAVTTEPVQTTEPVYTAEVAKDGVSDYVIVYDASNSTIQSEVTSYVSKMKSRFGITIQAEAIEDVNEPYEHEIIVGDVGALRDCVNTVKANCNAGGDFAVSVQGDDVVLYATNDINYKYLFAALIAEEGLKPVNKSLTYSSDQEYYHASSPLKEVNYAEYKGKSGQLTQLFVTSLFSYHETTTASGAKLAYRLYVPSDYTPEKEYPLLVVLHGAGERGTDNDKHMIYMLRKMFNHENSPVDDAIILCPQCPENQQWVDTPWSNGNYNSATVAESDELQTVMKIVDGLRGEYKVDANRIYAMGISMGGFGTWDLLIRHGDVFAAGIPICGGGDPRQAKALAEIPIWTFHGSADGVVPPSGTKQMAQVIKNAGAKNFQYEEFEGAGHDIWETVAAREDVIRWLFEQSMADRS